MLQFIHKDWHMGQADRWHLHWVWLFEINAEFMQKYVVIYNLSPPIHSLNLHKFASRDNFINSFKSIIWDKGDRVHWLSEQEDLYHYLCIKMALLQ